MLFSLRCVIAAGVILPSYFDRNAMRPLGNTPTGFTDTSTRLCRGTGKKNKSREVPVLIATLSVAQNRGALGTGVLSKFCGVHYTSFSRFGDAQP